MPGAGERGGGGGLSWGRRGGRGTCCPWKGRGGAGGVGEGLAGGEGKGFPGGGERLSGKRGKEKS